MKAAPSPESPAAGRRLRRGLQHVLLSWLRVTVGAVLLLQHFAPIWMTLQLVGFAAFYQVESQLVET